MGQDDENRHFTHILLVWGEDKTIPDTSSESICPPTSFNCKGPIDLTDTVMFNPFEFALFSSSPRTLPTLDGGRVQTEVAKEREGGRPINHASSSFSAKE